jgi:hypothetical protein
MAMRDLIESRARIAAAMRQIVENPEDSGDLSEDQNKRFETLRDELQATETHDGSRSDRRGRLPGDRDEG